MIRAAALEREKVWDEIVKRRAFILEQIEAQGKLTPELSGRIRLTFDLQTLEDLYLR